MAFSDETCASVLPGMVGSIDVLIHLNRFEGRAHFQTGSLVAAVILGGHACELLLKYKLEREGTPFERCHDLYDLYELLKDESKEAIERELDRLLSGINRNSILQGWRDAESVIKSARLASVEWRYIVETHRKEFQSSHVAIDMLYRVVLSVFRTTPLYIPN